MEVNTPEELWNSYRDFVYEKDSVSETEDLERKRAFLAGSETAFKLIDDWLKASGPQQAFKNLKRYRKLNRQAAMETVEDDEPEENLNN